MTHHRMNNNGEIENKNGTMRVWYATSRIRGFVLSGAVGNAYKFCTSTVLRERLASEELGIVYFKEFGISIFNYGRDSTFFFRALDTVAVVSERMGFRNAPWILFGHSVDGIFAQNIAVWKPGRTVGIIHYKSGNLGNPAIMFEPCTTIAPIKDIPFLAVSGRYEEYGPDGVLAPGQSRETQWWAIRDTLRDLRTKGYRCALAVDHYGDASHTSWSIESAELMALFAHSVARAQIPTEYDGSSAVALERIPESEGWLSDTAIPALIDSPTILAEPVESAFDAFPAHKRSTAYWHSDSVVARRWVDFHTAGDYPGATLRPRIGIGSGARRLTGPRIHIQSSPYTVRIELRQSEWVYDSRGVRLE
ncbi:MAG: hypothetical protein GF363_09115 [Chitinivibrionales bacterium]|nr:hypothetical protein [Chitinivibrionales bacterium]